MKAHIRILATLAAVLILVGTIGCGGPESKCESTARDFVKAVERVDSRRIKRLLRPGIEHEAPHYYNDSLRIVRIEEVDADMRADGERCFVAFYGAFERRGEEQSVLYVDLFEVGGSYRVDSYSSHW